MDLRSLSAQVPADRLRALARRTPLPSTAGGAVLFADIAGFTPLTNALAQTLGPRRGAEELTRHLNVVYGALIAQVDRFGGSVVDFSGDAVTCWFGDVAGDGDDNGTGDGSRRAVTAALALQQAMGGVGELVVPDGPAVRLAVKVAVAAGRVGRVVVGDPRVRRIDVIAGGTVDRTAHAEQTAAEGEIVLDRSVVAALGTDVAVTSWRDGSSGPVAVLGSLQSPAAPEPWPEVGPVVELAEWVDRRLRDRDEEASTELRPAVALFVRFSGIDFDTDPRAGDRLDAYVRWVQGILEIHDGHLLQVTMGDKGSYLYAAFGAPTAHEDLADRALAAALELRSTPPASTGMTAPPAIGIDQGIARVGAYGGQSRRTYGVLGDAVNLAARLMASADPGTILVTTEVLRASRRRLVFEELESITVKGHVEPIAVARLVGRPVGTAAVAFGPLVGRQAELSRLARALGGVVSGPGGAVVVEGEPGVGKSHLVDEARRWLLTHHDVTWLAVATDDGHPGSLAPFLPVLRDLFYLELAEDGVARRALFDLGVDGRIEELQELGTQDAQALASRIADERSYLAALLGIRWDGSAFEHHDPSTRLDRCLQAIDHYLCAESLLRPLVLHVRDAHQLDDDSLRLVEHLVTSAEDHRMCVVLDRRPDGSPLSLKPERTIVLAPLDGQGVGAMIEGILGAPAAPELRDHLHHRTGGNALFVEQLVVDLHRRGRLVLDPVRGWALPDRSGLDLPVTLNAVLLSRLDHLVPAVARVAQAGAVLGEAFELGVVAAMGVVPTDQLAGMLAAGEADGVWSSVDGERYRFRHALLRDAAYGMQLDDQLRSQHRVAARAIVRCRGREGTAADTARHLRSAGVPWRAAADFRRAADQAVQASRLREAIGHYEAALEQAEAAGCTARVRTALHEGAANAAAALGDHAVALDHLGAVLGDGDLMPAGLVALRTLTGESLHRLGRLGQAEVEYDAALVALQDAPDLSVASRIYAGLAMVHGQIGQLDEALELANVALTFAQGDDGGEARAHQRVAQIHWSRDEHDESVAHGLEALERYGRTGDRRGRAAVRNNLGLAYASLGRTDQAMIEFRAAVDEFDRTGNEHGLACALDNLAGLCARTGAGEEAMAHLERAVEILARIGMGPDGVVAAMWQGGCW